MHELLARGNAEAPIDDGGSTPRVAIWYAYILLRIHH
jgi:hypothetical protein